MGSRPTTEIGAPQKTRPQEEEGGEPSPPDQQDAADGPDDAACPDRRGQQPDPRLAEVEEPDRGHDDEDREHPADERLHTEDGHHEQRRRQPPEYREPGQEALRRSPMERVAPGRAHVRQLDRRANLHEGDGRQCHPNRCGDRDRCRSDHEQSAAEGRANEEAHPFARAADDVGGDELRRRSGEAGDDRVLERTDRRGSHCVTGRDDQDDEDGRFQGKGHRRGDAGRQGHHVDAQEHMDPRVPVAQGRGERDPDHVGGVRARPRIPTPAAPPRS